MPKSKAKNEIENIQIVWFKRDLRVEDNDALLKASSVGPVIPLYIIEPELWKQEDMSHRHCAFLYEALDELDLSLSQLGQKLIIKIGNVVETFIELFENFNITAVWSHQETWNLWTYNRDKKVSKWCKDVGIPWHQIKQHGVIRALKSRDGWSNIWNEQMNQTPSKKPNSLIQIPIESEIKPDLNELGLKYDLCNYRQFGTRAIGISLLNSFLNSRGYNYSKGMSSPVTAYDCCSRISPYIAFGLISIREVFQIASAKETEIYDLPFNLRGNWPRSLKSFMGRLRWHCHFIQKLEDQPSIEYKNLHSGYDGLREKDFNYEYFEKWKSAQTGFPMIDACMRALIETGWLNFRMRALLMSFASNNLWLHWRDTSIYLAKLFTDYEPGIHYSQTQMQSGTTGINSIRIYCPIKQSKDHDPEGTFIRTWIPELSHLTNDEIHEPWKHKVQNKLYPNRVVDEKITRKHAANMLYSIRKNKSFPNESKIILKKHGSRKRTRK